MVLYKSYDLHGYQEVGTIVYLMNINISSLFI
jgi:hypothetical protein